MQPRGVSARSKRICVPRCIHGKVEDGHPRYKEQGDQYTSPIECLLKTVEKYERFCANGACEPPGLPQGPTLMGHCLWPGSKRLPELWPTSTEVNNHSLLTHICAYLFDINLSFIPYISGALAFYGVYDYH